MEYQTVIQVLVIMSTFICELFIFYLRIPLKHFVLILTHVINIPIVVSGGIRFFAWNKEAVLKLVP